MFIPDPNFSISDLGLKRFRIPDPDPHQRVEENCFYALENMIRDPDLDLLPDPGVKKAPHPVSGSATLHLTQEIQICIHLCS
jgi:hypothetical protein